MFPLPATAVSVLDQIMRGFPARVLHTSNMKIADQVEVRKSLKRKMDKMMRDTRMNAADEKSAYEDLAQYAILSHRWGDGEVTFQEICGAPDHDVLRRKRKGFQKLEKFCQMARLHGCKWAWADTCCIDKSSSAELDEAIRSMYQWYSKAAICIVHLADTEYLDDLPHDAWFTRGWTLQELLAPTRIKFFNRDWQPLTSDENDKHSALSNTLATITTIPLNDIRNFMPGTDDIREKMSWAARRTTTRIEDVAYSLIGIFDVSMTIAYGEGDRAFYRLQLAIMEDTYSVELFNWEGRPSAYNAMLPVAPNGFVGWTTSVPPKTLQDISPRFLREIGPDTLRNMDPVVLARLGGEMLQHMDLETLRRVGPHLVQICPQIGETIGWEINMWMSRSYQSWMSWGGQTFAMTNAGLRIDAVLYDVKWTNIDGLYNNGEFIIRPHLKRLDHKPVPIRINPISHCAIIPTDLVDLPQLGPIPSAKLAVLDYNCFDIFGDHTSLQSKLDRAHRRAGATGSADNVAVATTEIQNRIYKAVIIRTTFRDDHYRRLFSLRPFEMRVIEVRRPTGGWDRPQTVYIR